jgi:hypothetical protein
LAKKLSNGVANEKDTAKCGPKFTNVEFSVTCGRGGMRNLLFYDRHNVRELTTLWAFPLHVYLYKNYNPNYKWEITTLRTLHDLEDQGVMSHKAIMSYNVTYL